MFLYTELQYSCEQADGFLNPLGSLMLLTADITIKGAKINVNLQRFVCLPTDTLTFGAE